MEMINMDIKHIRINGYLQVPKNISMAILKELLEQNSFFFLGFMEDNVEYSTEEYLKIINDKLEDE
jgi:hypothetical protein